MSSNFGLLCFISLRHCTAELIIHHFIHLSHHRWPAPGSPTPTRVKQHHFAGLWCRPLAVKTLTRNSDVFVIISANWNSCLYQILSLQFSSSCRSDKCLNAAGEALQSEQLIFLTFYLLFFLTPFCLCVGTFHIQLTTAHPPTRPSRSFQSVLCFVFVLFLLFFLHKVSCCHHTRSTLCNSGSEQQHQCVLSPSCWYNRT